ncbi:MAG: PfkB family carbohydrate kinase [Thermoplasmata archaeon]
MTEESDRSSANGRLFDVVCIGSATQDVFVKTNLSKIITIRDPVMQKEYLSFEYGDNINIDSIRFLGGGGGSNTSVSFARLGLKSAFVGKVGNDEVGQKVLEDMRKEGVDVSLVRKDECEITGYSVILNSFEGDRTVLTYRGANNHLEWSELDLEKLKNADWFYITSLSGNSALILDELAEFAEANNICCAMCPGGTQIKRGLKGLARILKTLEVLVLNKEEASALSGVQFSHMAADPELCIGCGTCVDVCPVKIFHLDEKKKAYIKDRYKCTKCGECYTKCPTRAVAIEPWADCMDEILKTLYSMGPKIVVITDGDKGAQAYDGKYRYLIPTYPANVVDTLGAGDSFGSGFVAGLIHSGWDIEFALRLGSVNAASVVEQFGAQPGLLSLDKARERMTAYSVRVRRTEMIAEKKG